MKDSTPPKDLPWIIWLLRTLCTDEEISDAKLYQDAEANGLIKNTGAVLWDVNRDWAKSLPNRIFPKRDLKTPEDAAYFVMAMAELSARCEELSIKECQTKLKKAEGIKNFHKVFDFMGELTSKHCSPAELNLEELAMVSWIKSCKWNYESYRSVLWFVDHPARLRLFDRWGLALGVSIAARLDSKAFGAWLTRQTDASIVCPALYTLPELVFGGNEEVSVSLLSSGNVFLELLGVASLHFYQHGPAGPKWKMPLKTAFRMFDSAGVNKENAIWTSFSRIQNLYSCLGNLEKRIEDYKANNYSERDVIEKFEGEHSTLKALFDQEVEAFILHFPGKGLSAERADYIIQSARGQVSLPMRLAEILPPESRQSLLKAIVNQFDNVSGLLGRSLDDSQPYSLSFDWQSDLPIAARAHALLYSGQDIERKFSRKVERPEKMLLPYVGQPYLVSRNHYLWTQVFGQLVIIYLYALTVASEKKKADPADESNFLNNYVTKQALNLLKYYHGEGTLREAFDALSRITASLASSTNEVKIIKLGKSLISHTSGYSVAKLYLLWSKQVFLEGNEELAFTLLNQLGVEFGDRNDRGSIFEVYIDIIDRALTLSTELGSAFLTRRLLDTWDASYSRWEDVVGEKWAKIPHIVAEALSGDKAGLAWLFANEAFKNSTSKLYCNRKFSI